MPPAPLRDQARRAWPRASGVCDWEATAAKWMTQTRELLDIQVVKYPEDAEDAEYPEDDTPTRLPRMIPTTPMQRRRAHACGLCTEPS